MGTYVCKPADASREWVVVDAERQALGRLSTHVARLLMGKHRPAYTPFVDTGDFVVVINAAKIRLTGRKAETKFYRWHTGYPGGLKEIAAGRVRTETPTRLIEWSVKGMLPKTRLGRRQGMKLKVYPGPEHPHQARRPVQATIPKRGRR